MEPQFWSELFKLAGGLGLGGLMLAAAVWYFKRENERLIVKLDGEQTAKLLIIESENKAKMTLFQEQNKWCMDDRAALHKICDDQQKRIDNLQDKIVDIYRSRHARMVVEQIKQLEDPNAALAKIETAKIKKMVPTDQP